MKFKIVLCSQFVDLNSEIKCATQFLIVNDKNGVKQEYDNSIESHSVLDCLPQRQFGLVFFFQSGFGTQKSLNDSDDEIPIKH